MVLCSVGIYNAKFTQTPAYDSLLIARPPGEPQEDCWRWLSMYQSYDPRRSKAISLHSPFLRYIHSLLSHIVTGQGGSTRAINRRDFEFLLSMVKGFHLHLGHEVAHSIHHQGTNPSDEDSGQLCPDYPRD